MVVLEVYDPTVGTGYATAYWDRMTAVYGPMPTFPW